MKELYGGIDEIELLFQEVLEFGIKLGQDRQEPYPSGLRATENI